MQVERLRLIRQARGLSLEELSEATGKIVTKQAISKYETGHDMPSARVFVALAKALHVRTEALLGAPEVSVEGLYFRKKSKLGKRRQEELHSFLAFTLEQQVRLRELVDPGWKADFEARSFPISTVGEAEQQAEALRKKWGLGWDPIGNVVDLLEGKGIAVCMIDAEDEFDGLSAVAKDARKKLRGAAVLCRTGIPRERQRLNLIHELGHILLNPDESIEEDCAWRFAGAFLVPKRTFLEDVGSFRKTLGLEEMKLLKKRYGVSISALLMRFKALEIMSADAIKRAFVFLSASGYRRREPGDTDNREEPQWMRRTAYRAVTEGLLHASEASEILGEPVEEPAKNASMVQLLARLPVDQRVEYLLTVAPESRVAESVDSWFETEVDWEEDD